MRAGFCPECSHCKAKAAPAEVPVSSIKLRPWDRTGYGAKLSGVVDWYDGWWVGTNAESKDVFVPAPCINKKAWADGFYQGWEDATNSREWRRTHSRVAS